MFTKPKELTANVALVNRIFRRILRPFGTRAQTLYNPQFHNLNLRTDSLSAQMTAQIHMVNTKIDEITPTFDTFNDSLARRIETEHERATYQQRLLSNLEASSTSIHDATAQMAIMKDAIENATGQATVLKLTDAINIAVERAQLGLTKTDYANIEKHDPAAPVTPAMAEVINWSNAHNGAASRYMLWFNEPVKVRVTPQAAIVTDVTERIVEIPFVYRALSGLPYGSKILDFGSAESTLSLSLASLGFNVVSADLREYPVSHPNLESVIGPIENWQPNTKFDAIISLSTLEHVGIGAYDENETEGTLDAVIVAKFAQWLKPDGIFILTAPFGKYQVDELQRTYDTMHVDTLLSDWKIFDRQTFHCEGGKTWLPIEEGTSWTSARKGVICITAKSNV